MQKNIIKKFQTYGQLRDFLNTLTEEQLQQKVLFSPDEAPDEVVTTACIMADDYLIGKDDWEDQGPRSYLEEDPDIHIDDYDVLYKTGTVILS